MSNNINVDDTIIRFRSCEEFWRENGAYFDDSFAEVAQSSICDETSFDETIQGFTSYFNCTDSLGCMLEDPNTVAVDSLVSWTQVTAESNELWESYVMWDYP